jgi:hypothetical protein
MGRICTWAIWAVFLLVTMSLGQVGVRRLLDRIRGQIFLPPISDDPAIQTRWAWVIEHPNPSGNWIGAFERVVLFGALAAGSWEAVGVWFGFKVASKWEAWSHMGFVPEEIKDVDPLRFATARRVWAAQGYATFVVGTAANLILAWLGVFGATQFNLIVHSP